MTSIEIKRTLRYSQSIAGELSVNGTYVCKTLELPWKWNQKDVSCIPAGSYQCWWRYDKQRVQLQNIPCPGGFRTGVQIHSGNTPGQIQGCILVGTSTGPNVIYHSKDAFGLLTAALFPGQLGPGYSGGSMTLRISGVLMDSRFENLDPRPGSAATA